ncbi:uncharacterized protein BXZ73DRAFT_78031 [Epithele typhae]|uniref:uncharacterized protein n=1 Tax=Epithele typhae TaxID=378194 RepID=UPI002008217A|nr:uncharacterized protein BXZ73DRAFT_78031 [Epithele typhae]KAH9929925.1 hypothetical protein BXZ73DRAFT_78031 [Epithele typhae]
MPLAKARRSKRRGRSPSPPASSQPHDDVDPSDAPTYDAAKEEEPDVAGVSPGSHVVDPQRSCPFYQNQHLLRQVWRHSAGSAGKAIEAGLVPRPLGDRQADTTAKRDKEQQARDAKAKRAAKQSSGNAPPQNSNDSRTGNKTQPSVAHSRTSNKRSNEQENDAMDVDGAPPGSQEQTQVKAILLEIDTALSRAEKRSALQHAERGRVQELRQSNQGSTPSQASHAPAAHKDIGSYVATNYYTALYSFLSGASGKDKSRKTIMSQNACTDDWRKMYVARATRQVACKAASQASNQATTFADASREDNYDVFDLPQGITDEEVAKESVGHEGRSRIIRYDYEGISAWGIHEGKAHADEDELSDRSKPADDDKATPTPPVGRLTTSKKSLFHAKGTPARAPTTPAHIALATPSTFKKSPIKLHALSGPAPMDGEPLDDDDDQNTQTKGKLQLCDMPAGVQLHLKPSIVPAVIEFIGELVRLWSTTGEPGKWSLASLVQKYLDEFIPGHGLSTITAKHPVYLWIRQQIYDYRKDIQRVATASVKDAVDERRLGPNLPRKDKTDTALKNWLIDATAKAGCISPDNAREIFRSPYILAVMAHHIHLTKGSARTESERRFPIGALALTCAAVQRAFENHRIQSTRSTTNFTFKDAGTLTAMWCNASSTILDWILEIADADSESAYDGADGSFDDIEDDTYCAQQRPSSPF